jgi:hypothetical protein
MLHAFRFLGNPRVSIKSSVSFIHENAVVLCTSFMIVQCLLHMYYVYNLNVFCDGHNVGT